MSAEDILNKPQPAPDARPVAAGLTPEAVDVTWTEDSGRPSTVAVSVRDFSVDAVFARFRFQNRPGVEFPYLGGDRKWSRFAPRK